MDREPAHLVGVISDTHGLLRPEALELLAGVEVILHAGDVGSPEILERLEALAPVEAVRGNIDRGAWADALPETRTVKIGGVRLLLVHDLKLLDLDPERRRYGAVISGHSHRARNERMGRVLFFNPGSAGPRRFRLPVTLGRLRIHEGVVNGEVLDLGLLQRAPAR